jgi:hypothetical protein
MEAHSVNEESTHCGWSFRSIVNQCVFREHGQLLSANGGNAVRAQLGLQNLKNKRENMKIRTQNLLLPPTLRSVHFAPLSTVLARDTAFTYQAALPTESLGIAPACFPGVFHRVWSASKAWLIRLALSALLCAVGANAQYSMDWHTIDGGGGTSTGGLYSVTGTIGQPDAGGPMTNGQYSVTGGFWTFPAAIQVPGAPTLTIVPATPGNATISWLPITPGLVLQETLSLSPSNWTNSPSGATNPIVVPATLPTKFYRLFKSANLGL